MLYEYQGPRVSVDVTRRFPVDPERMFAAWLDPAAAGNWLFNTKTSQVRYELDMRVGGSYTITGTRGGQAYVAAGQYLAIDRPRRLSFTFAMPQYAADADTVIVDIEPEGDGCLVTVTG